MINDLFINTLLLVSFTFIGGHGFREFHDKLKDNYYFKVVIGLSGGMLGILMMIYTIEIPKTNILLDLRILAVMMISDVSSLTSTIVSGVVIVFYRIGIYGINKASIFALIHVFLYIVAFYTINKSMTSSWKRWFLKLGIGLFILDLTLIYLLKNVEGFYSIIITFSLVIIAAALLEYSLINYTRRSNELYRIYKTDSAKDFLTGLSNTRSFDNQLNLCFKRALENKEKLACLMIDIDHFKKVNDTYGHAAGDLVLKELAGILTLNCRAFDLIGRVGGEEFCALLLDCSIERAEEIGMNIRNAVKAHSFYIKEDTDINITVSIGAASYPDTVSNTEELTERADVALYKAKQMGRDRVCI